CFSTMEAQLPRRTGGWITFPFIIASSVGLTLAFGGWTNNLIVYLIKEFDVESIDAAQISNLVNGAGSLIPVVAAIIADSFLGCFSTIWISSIISLLVMNYHCFFFLMNYLLLLIFNKCMTSLYL
ncbi:hypothetical protein EJD97_010892, partial [Solanum chilense]